MLLLHQREMHPPGIEPGNPALEELGQHQLWALQLVCPLVPAGFEPTHLMEIIDLESIALDHSAIAPFDSCEASREMTLHGLLFRRQRTRLPGLPNHNVDHRRDPELRISRLFLFSIMEIMCTLGGTRCGDILLQCEVVMA